MDIDLEHGGAGAIELAAAVRDGRTSPVELVRASLERIQRLDPRVGAFVSVRQDAALAEAEVLAAREDLADLPLAGVPVAIKDNVDVEGEPTRIGVAALAAKPAEADDTTVARLRAAGAVVVGKTRLPEMGIWPFSDDATGAALNPWDLTRVAGGSSGGSAAAVAAGMVPLALGNDGLGSIRIPAAATGLFGIKPGSGLVPITGIDGTSRSWFGMTQHGPLATRVADAALMLDVIAGTDRYREAAPPQEPLRVAVSVASPSPTVRPAREQVESVMEAGRLLRSAGHHVVRADPPYRVADILPVLARFTQAVADDLEVLDLDESELQPRTRTHARIGRWFRRRRPVDPVDADRVAERMRGFFADVDLLVTPTVAGRPPLAHPWHERSWLSNFNAAFSWAVFPGLWNLVDQPAASVPIPQPPGQLPVGVQLVAPPEREETILAAAAQLESLAPWPRTAPLASAPSGA